MKKIILLFCFVATVQTIFAQNKTADSLKIVLSKTTKPIERFNLLNKIFETNDVTLGTLQDSSTGLQMHRIAQQLKNDSLIAISTNVIGNYFRGKSDIPTALDYFFKAIPLAEKTNDKRRISSLYFDIAECYYNLLNLEKCYKYAMTGAQNLPDRDSPMFDYMAVQFYRTMGNYYLKKNMPDSALKQIHELEEVNSRLKRISYILYSYIQNGTAYYQLGENDLAEIYFKKARVVSDSIATPGRTQLFINAYIPFLLATNQVEKARQQAFELFNIGQQIDNNLTRLNAAGFLSQAYNRLHQPDSAFYYLNLESSLKDSVFNQTNINKIQALAFNEQIRKIDEEARQAAADTQRKQNIQYALLALGILTFVILFLALSRRHITNTKVIQFLGVVALLVVFEFLNLLLHPFLERITHHNPILMLLALVCIAALLVPLHHRLEKWATHKLVEKNKQIRLAAAKKTIEQLENEQNSQRVMKNILFLFIFLANLYPSFSQSRDIDSLLSTIAGEKNENERFDTILEFFAYTAESDPLLDLNNAQKLLHYAQKNGDRISEAVAFSKTGYDYRSLGNLEKSLENNLKAVEVAEQTGNEKIRVYTSMNLSYTYKALGNYPKTISLLMYVAENAAKINYFKAQSWAYGGLAVAYLEMNNTDSALLYGQRCYELCLAKKYFDYFGYRLINLGDIHARLHNPSLAVSYYDMAIQEGYRTGSAKQLNWAYTAKATYFTGTNNGDSAMFYAKKAIRVVQHTAFSNYSLQPAKLLLDRYKTLNSDSALKYAEIYRLTNDSLYNAKAIQQTQLLTFENDLRQQELAAAKTKEAQQRKQNIQYALLALGILTFIIIFLGLSRRHITNTKLIQFLGVVALLLVFEFLNLLLHPFLEHITHHNPVLMLLALVCIAALLVPLHHKLEKWATHKLVEKNKAIRLAAAKKTIKELEK